MFDHRKENVREENTPTWPPAISRPPAFSVRPASARIMRVGFLSAALSIAGLLCELFLSICLWTLYNINADNFWLDRPIHVSFALSLMFGLAGVVTGAASKKTGSGNVGWRLSVGVLFLIVIVTFWEHNAHQTGQWIWNSDYSDCGCHELLGVNSEP